jgi:hypothetical protein
MVRTSAARSSNACPQGFRLLRCTITASPESERVHGQQGLAGSTVRVIAWPKVLVDEESRPGTR